MLAYWISVGPIDSIFVRLHLLSQQNVIFCYECINILVPNHFYKERTCRDIHQLHFFSSIGQRGNTEYGSIPWFVLFFYKKIIYSKSYIQLLHRKRPGYQNGPARLFFFKNSLFLYYWSDRLVLSTIRKRTLQSFSLCLLKNFKDQFSWPQAGLNVGHEKVVKLTSDIGATNC